MSDYKLEMRRAALTAMKHDAALADLIPAASMYPGTVPAKRAFPFTRFGSIVTSPFRASGMDSSAFRLSIQGFTKPLVNGAGAVIASAEDQADRIGSAIKDALDSTNLALEAGEKAIFTWIQTITMRDGDEADAWMATVTFGVEVAG